MCHPFPGFSGNVVGVFLAGLMWWLVSKRTPKAESFCVERQPGEFKEILTFYLQIGGILVTLASGSLVFLVGSSLFKNGQLSWLLASPLFLLAQAVLYVILFMVFMTLNYEHFKHDRSTYTRPKYVRNQALGFAGVLCFCAGYLWLIFVLTNLSTST